MKKRKECSVLEYLQKRKVNMDMNIEEVITKNNRGIFLENKKKGQGK